MRFSLATIAFETFELILCQMLSSQGKNAPSHPYPHYLVRLATSRKERRRRHLSAPKSRDSLRPRRRFSRAAKQGGFKQGGFPDLDLSFLFCPSLGLSRFFRDFPNFAPGGSGDFPDSSLFLSRPNKSTYEEQFRKGPRHNLDLSKKVGNPPLWKPPGLDSLKFLPLPRKFVRFFGASLRLRFPRAKSKRRIFMTPVEVWAKD